MPDITDMGGILYPFFTKDGEKSSDVLVRNKQPAAHNDHLYTLLNLAGWLPLVICI